MRAIQSLAVAVLVGSALTGCSDDEGDSSPLSFERNIDTWALPLDAYLPNPAYQEYGHRALMHACLQDKGYKDQLVDPRGFIPATYSSRLRSLFNSDFAGKYGYRAGEAALPSSAGNEPEPSSPAEATARRECSQAAAKRLGFDSVQSEIEGLGATAYVDAKRDPEVLKAGERWRTCMLPLGIPDLPQNPVDGQVPTDTQRARFGTSDRTKKAGPARAIEIKEATFDADCRDSSGWTKAIYEAEVRLQLELADENRELLERAAAHTAETNKAVRDAVAAVGGDTSE